MAFRGERFLVNLDDETPTIPNDPVPSPFSLVGEIREREPSNATPPAPAPPTPSASLTGFPAHRRRNKPSSFKQRRAKQHADDSPPDVLPTPQDDKQAIAEENRRHLASMSDSQIEKEREELIASMDPGLLKRFLYRAKIDEDEQASADPPPAPTLLPTSDVSAAPKPQKSVSFDLPTPAPAPQTKPPQPAPNSSAKRPVHDDFAPTQPPKDLHPASERPILDPAAIETFHFPQPTQPMPALDPSSPNFLSDLQSHYFPEMSHDPSALAAVSMAPSSVRFSLRGTILAPATSLALPTSLGLHHHGDDPHAAGYTIPELAILSRSTFPAQRCVAWQVLGRILFRLGRAEFGDRGGPLSEGLWFVIEKEGVVAGMLAEAEGAAGQSLPAARGEEEEKKDEDTDESPNKLVASGIGRHASAAAWAVEGVWLWQQGGGGDRGLLKEGQTRPR
ncbi:RNA polymerase II-associated protein 1 N-terminal [Penicillium macrosclerotiorum]|uniref:RNA polymerase II-associated protein 1 N-terminal n=1 Tax=Penicillium macrosclerotiorum TaxID=303699 RepID=UPI002547B37D|nr:RNA polymerase II-associated protein 1 N-terminal [Penicillium macrosclerotiorum]KAJ5692127.1 RNA polymerase II-associated protein 1 N-terminal [Penicillium macrosclerotiorum]